MKTDKQIIQELIRSNTGFERGEAIGSTAVSALNGVNPFQGKWDIYEALVNGVTVEFTSPMKRGLFMEEGILGWYCDDREGERHEIETISFTYRGVKFRDTPDGLLVKPDGTHVILEAKSVSPRAYKKWQYGAPDYYLAQCQYHLGVAINVLGYDRDTTYCELIAFDGGELTTYPVQYDEELFFDLLNNCVDFWDNHVLTKTPPPVDSTDGCSQALAKIEPVGDTILQADEEQLADALRLGDIRQEIKELQDEEKELKNKLCEAIGVNDGIEGTGFKATWRRSKGRERTDWKKVALGAGASEELIRRYTATAQWARVFRFSTRSDG